METKGRNATDKQTVDDLRAYVHGSKIKVGGCAPAVIDEIRRIFGGYGIINGSFSVYHPFLYVSPMRNDGKVTVTTGNNVAEYLCSDLKEIDYSTFLILTQKGK